MNQVQQPGGPPSGEKDDARVGYQVAVQMWAQTGQELWARFNIMLVANSIFMAVVGLNFTIQHPVPSLGVFLPVLGVILCGVWFIMTRRSFEYQIYYLRSARELEERHLAGTVTTISRGEEFAKGRKFTMQINNRLFDYPVSRSAHLLTGQCASYVVIVIFVIAYVILLWQAKG
jgi:hypothetical protein